MNTPSENPSDMSTEEIRDLADLEADRIAKLGNWPEWKAEHAKESFTSRIPDGDKEAPGFDAGIACALGMIPLENQKLAAALHGNYTPESVQQVIRESKEMDPNSDTIWWLAACSLCEEGGINEEKFRKQLAAFDELSADPQARVEAAKKELNKMKSTFEISTYGVPFGTEDGCMQGAYLAGFPFATTYSENDGIFFIGTFHDSLGLENFEWSDEKDDQGRDKSGPVFGSKQFIKCANEDEFKKVIEIVKSKFKM